MPAANRFWVGEVARASSSPLLSFPLHCHRAYAFAVCGQTPFMDMWHVTCCYLWHVVFSEKPFNAWTNPWKQPFAKPCSWWHDQIIKYVYVIYGLMIDLCIFSFSNFKIERWVVGLIAHRVTGTIMSTDTDTALILILILILITQHKMT